MTETMTAEEKRQRELAFLFLKLRRALGEAPGLLGYVWSKRLRFGATPSSGGRVSGSKTPPAPVREQAFDDANRAYAVLVNWAAVWSREFGEREPSVAAAWSRAAFTKTKSVRDALGFPGITTPEGAAALTRPIAAYLLRRQPDILATDPSGSTLTRARAEQYASEVIEGLGDLRRRYRTSGRIHDRGQQTRACPICNHLAVEVSWYSDDLHDLIVQCHHCRANTTELNRALGITVRKYQKFLSWLDTGHHVDDTPPVPYDRRNAAHVHLARALGRTDLYLPPQ